MEHEEAIRIEAAERYVLGALTAEDREAYEEHFFSCEECAEEVRWVAIFNANARQVLSEQDTDGASAVAASVAKEPPSPGTPQAYTSVWLAPGSAPIVEPAAEHGFAGLSLALPNPLFDHYRCSVAGQFSLDVARSPEGRLHLLVPAAAIAPGTHTLVVSGFGPGELVEIGRYAFSWRR